MEMLTERIFQQRQGDRSDSISDSISFGDEELRSQALDRAPIALG